MVPLVVGKASSIVVEVAGAISTPVLNFGSTVSSCINGSPTFRARRMAGMMTDMLDTMMATADSTPPKKEEHARVSGIRTDGKKISLPKMASQTPGLTKTMIACTNDATVVAMDIEKMENKRKRRALI